MLDDLMNREHHHEHPDYLVDENVVKLVHDRMDQLVFLDNVVHHLDNYRCKHVKYHRSQNLVDCIHEVLIQDLLFDGTIFGIILMFWLENVFFFI